MTLDVEGLGEYPTGETDGKKGCEPEGTPLRRRLVWVHELSRAQVMP